MCVLSPAMNGSTKLMAAPIHCTINGVSRESIHSFLAVRSITFSVSRPGVFFGQCSEICGANHRFIPIKLEVVPIKTFIYPRASCLCLTCVVGASLASRNLVQ